MTESDIFSLHMQLPYSAVTANGWARADWLLNIFQDIASQQCHTLGVSGFHMAEKGLKWVVAQYRIHIHTPMNWLFPFTLSTWRYPFNNLYEVRRFTITDPEGRTRVEASGIWILIKSDTGRPVRLGKHLPEPMMQVQGPDPGLIKTHPDIQDTQPATRFRVLFQDLDLNQHVNNGVYLKWALESMPRPHGFSYTPVKAQVYYLKECFFPDRIDCRVAITDTPLGITSSHAIVRSGSDVVLARVALDWQKCDSLAPFHG